MNSKPRKRIDVVRIKMIRESTVLYEPRKISSPKDAVKLIRCFLDDLDREATLVICLDTKNQPVSVNLCSIGTVDASIVHPREVFKSAILANATSIIIAHNHLTAGEVRPSREDKSITGRLREASEIMGIALTDHIIVGKETDQFISLKEQGVL